MCYDTFEPLRERILKESDPGKQALKLARDLKAS